MKRRMRRKIFAILTTVAMVLSMAPAALAGPFSDVPDNHQYAGAINRLAELGVLEGVGGGKYDPEGTYTRAQFAALVTKIMGLKAAAEASKGATDFSDVPADHWASGYVNVASSMGIIKGYGDGTFKPDKLVNHAEALTMLVRALGYEPVLKGKWPANVLVKAAELGLTSGVTVVANLPASRGEVAQFSNNAIDVPMIIQTGYGDNVSYCVSGSKGCGDEKKKTLLMGSLGQTVEGVVIGSAERVDSNVKTNELVIDVGGTAKTYKVAAGVNVLNLLGHKVTALTRSMGADTVIVGLSERDDSNFSSKVVKTISSTSLELCDWDVTGATYKDCNTRNYVTPNSPVVFANGKKVAAANVAGTLGASGAGDVRASVKLNSSDEIEAAVLYNYKGAKLASAVNTSKQRVDYKIGATDNLDGYTVVVIRDGKVASLADLQAGDVVHALTSTSPKRAVIYARSATVSGTFGGADDKANPKVVYIGGTTYSLGSNTVSTDNGDNYNKTISDIDANANVTAYVDGAGRIMAIKTGQAAAAATKNYALVTSIWREGAPGSHVFKVKMFLGTGSSVTYDLNDDTKVNGATYKVSDGTKTTKNVTDAVYEGTANTCESDAWTTCDFATKVGAFVMVTYELSGSATLTKLDTVHGTLSPNRVDTTDVSTLNFDADTNRIDGIRVDTGAVVFDVKDAVTGGLDASKLKVRTWDAVKKATGTRQGEYVVDGRIKAILLRYYTDLGTGGLARAIVTGAQWVGGDNYKLTVLQEDGTTKEYTAKDADWDITKVSGCTNGDWTTSGCTPAKKLVVTVEQVGSTVTVKEVAKNNGPENGDVTEHDTSYERIKVGGNDYYYDSATVVVFDASGDTITKSSMSSVSNGTNVTLYLKSSTNLIEIAVIN